MTIDQEMRGASVVFGTMLRDENIQVNGMIFVFDMTGVGTKQMSRFSSSDMRKWHSFLKEVAYLLNVLMLLSTNGRDMSYG